MQTPKAKASSSEVPQRKSPRTARAARQIKTRGSGPDSVSTSPQAASRTSKEKSPWVLTDRKSPRCLATERKGLSKVAELESKLSKLQEDFKKTSDKLSESESHRKEAQKQLSDMSAKLEESQQQILELSASEEARVQELHKISQDRDRACKSELEAVQKQHATDNAALASTMNEVQTLKFQLEMVSESETSRSNLAKSTQAEIEHLRAQLSQTLSLVEKLKDELSYCKESEAQAQDVARKNQNQYETAKAAVEKLQSDGTKAMEAYNSLPLELEQSKAQIQSLEGQISKIPKSSLDSTGNNKDEINEIKTEPTAMRLEADKTKSALIVAETRYEEEHVCTTLQIRIAHELVEQMKVESCQKEEALNAELKELKTKFLDKEAELQITSEENKVLQIEIEKIEMERNRIKGEAVTLAETTTAAEQEAVMKLEQASEEADKSSRRAARAEEQLDAAPCCKFRNGG